MLVINLTILVLLYQVNISNGLYFNESNNACPTWQQYNLRAFDPKCRYNPDGDRSTLEEIVKSYNYPVEAHNVSTRDNYVLTQFRINKNNGPAVLLVHGLNQNAIAWTLKTQQSLAFVLSDAGYDVWLANLRGTVYSSNTVYGESSEEYWDFTPHEMGTIDLPAILEHIYSVNGNKQIQVLAFSMGTTSMLIYTSMMPQHALKYVANQTLMAPVATLNNLHSPFAFSPILWTVIGSGLEASNQYYILKPTKESTQSSVQAYTPTTANVLAYWTVTGALYGYSCQLNPDTFITFIKKGGDAMSTSILDFYDNIIKKGIFVAYDYGDDTKNNQHYGTSTPPIYPLDQIQTPTSLVYGDNDQLATTENVATLAGQLTTSTCVVRVALSAFTHSDFVNAIDAYTLVYQPLVNEILKGSCNNATAYDCVENYFGENN